MRQYRTEIDGLRAIAVLGVLLFHLKLNTGGWLGVDIFFVISGFLISSNLFKEFESTGKISASNFYLRRIRRIMPALLVCIIITFIPFALLLSYTPAFSEFSQSILTAVFSISNIFFWKHAGYFAIKADLCPLLHTWTLGIEEQFYLIIPAIFVILPYFTKKKQNTLWIFVFIATILSFLACRYGHNLVSTDFRFYMLPTRMWELFAGLFIALLLKNFPQLNTRNVYTELLSGISICFLCFIFISFIGNSNFTENSLFAVLATCIFIVTTTENSITGKLMSLRPIRFVGNISYSTYLWHWPIIVITYLLTIRFDINNSILIKVCIIISTLYISYLSWKFIEKPFRKKTTWSDCLKPLSPFITIAFILAIIGISALSTGKSHYKLNQNKLKTNLSFNDFKNEKYYSFGNKQSSPQFFVVGDSHARAIAPALNLLDQEYGINGKEASITGTPPLFNIYNSEDDNIPYEAEWIKYIKKNKIKNVLLVANWNKLFDATTLKYNDEKIRQEEAFSIAKKELITMLKLLTEQGATVWVMKSVPVLKNNPVVISRLLNKPYIEKESPLINFNFIQRALENESIPNIYILSPTPYLIENGNIISVQDGHLLYEDTNHLSVDGAYAIKEVFRPFFESMQHQ
ncbi:acyltransferase family protein [Desulfovibrio sp. UCD-KL4C]|uniref:acyltransferase family protein n=1 Tax=Desulfovibrio sp. UCD-KL4C TaxID=2578120 RepID=UPI0025B8BC4D|nr:acyltransferase family protein [Desulfovibrio sp. UCD-KL4C]